jgi:hypothetical protein
MEAPEATLDPFRTVSEGVFSEARTRMREIGSLRAGEQISSCLLPHKCRTPPQDVVVVHIYSKLSLFLHLTLLIQYPLMPITGERGKHRKGR